VGKTLAAIGLVLLFRYSLHTALTVGASLAQIGEFSFILAGLGVALGLMPVDGQSLVLAAALITIAANTVMFSAIGPIETWLLARFSFMRQLEQREDDLAELPESTDLHLLSQQVVLVGYGRVGKRIGWALKNKGIPFVVAEQNREVVEALRQEGVPAVSGDALTPEVLVQAHVARAAMLVIAIPDTINVRKMVEIARTLNPGIQIVLRTHNEEEAALLKEESMGAVFVGEHELARGMTNHILANLGAQRAKTKSAPKASPH